MRRIIQANIDRFTLMLGTETDPAKRAILARLLAEQEAKLLHEPKDAKTAFYRSAQNRQCEGAMSIRFSLAASTHSAPRLRHGKINACTPPLSITHTSRSRSGGAIETGNHFSGSE